MRNNEDRLGVKDEGQSPPIPTKNDNQSDPLQFVTPTEFVDLPTKGKFYPADHPLHNKETVEIRFMTAKDEDILTSKTLLKKGIAVDRMLGNLLIDKTIKVDDLFVGDKNALIVSARISGYGSDYKTNVTCPSCGTSADWTFDLNEVLSGNEIMHEKAGNTEITNDGTFIVELPKSKVQAECRLLTGQAEKSLTAQTEKRKKHKLPEATLTSLLKMFIVSLNGESDEAVIARFVEQMPALDSKYLRAFYNKVVPNVDMKQTYQCESCDADTPLDMPFSVSFFWPNE
jgi:hypothetical protein